MISFSSAPIAINYLVQCLLFIMTIYFYVLTNYNVVLAIYQTQLFSVRTWETFKVQSDTRVSGTLNIVWKRMTRKSNKTPLLKCWLSDYWAFYILQIHNRGIIGDLLSQLISRNRLFMRRSNTGNVSEYKLNEVLCRQ